MANRKKRKSLKNRKRSNKKIDKKKAEIEKKISNLKNLALPERMGKLFVDWLINFGAILPGSAYLMMLIL